MRTKDLKDEECEVLRRVTMYRTHCSGHSVPVSDMQWWSGEGPGYRLVVSEKGVAGGEEDIRQAVVGVRRARLVQGE